MYTSLQLLDLCADVEDFLLVLVVSLPCSSWLACDDSLLVACSTATVLGGTVLVGLEGLDDFAVLPVLSVHPVLTLEKLLSMDS